MKTKALVFVAIFLFYLTLKYSVSAAAPVILSAPSSIGTDSQFTLTATMSGLSKGAIYRLRIVLAQPNTTNYFGSTNNGTDWYSGIPSPINYSKFLSITTDKDGSWNGEILGKFESGDSNYKNTGSGLYDLKFGRYTENGSTATWSNIISVNLAAPSATPTNIPTPKSIATNTPTSKPQNTNTPFPTKSPTPFKNQSSTIAQVSNNTPVQSQDVKEVLGNNIKPSVTNYEKSKQKLTNEVLSATNSTVVPKILIILGTIFLLLCGIVISYPFIQRKIIEKKSDG